MRIFVRLLTLAGAAEAARALLITPSNASTININRWNIAMESPSTLKASIL